MGERDRADHIASGAEGRRPQVPPLLFRGRRRDHGRAIRSMIYAALFVWKRSIGIYQSGIVYDQIAIEAFEVIEIPTHRDLSLSQHGDAADGAAFNGRGTVGPRAHIVYQNRA